MSLRANYLAVAVGVLVSACAREHAQYTVEEYRANDALRHAQVERCRNDPGSLAKTPDCINARQAAAFEDRVRLRDAPPIGLAPQRHPSSSAPDGEPGDSKAGEMPPDSAP